MTKWTRHLYQPCLPLGEDGRRITGCDKHIQLSRQAATEGMVLLKNNDNILPLKGNPKVALFGKGTVDYVKGGGGSGDVTTEYARSLYDGLKIKEEEGKVQIFHELVAYYEKEVKAQYEELIAPGMTEEPELPDDLLNKAADFADTAIISICRFSGEGWDRRVSTEPNDTLWEEALRLVARQAKVFPNSDYCLTNREKVMIEQVKSKFSKVIVVFNVGGVMETKCIKDDNKIQAALYAWQGGIEGGLACADLLVGDATPSGKLADTFAETLDDYPSTYNFHDSLEYAEYTDDIYVGYRYFETIPGASNKVVYPFGYGLSYTTFDVKALSVDISDTEVAVKVNVKNTGDYKGKEVVMLYYSAPEGKMGKPSRELGAFAKTSELQAGDDETLVLTMKVADMASFDDTGVISKSAWVLESGTYSFYIGSNVRELTKLEEIFEIAEGKVVEQLTSKIAPSNLKERLRNDGTMEPVPAAPEKLTSDIFPRMTVHEVEGVIPGEHGWDLYVTPEDRGILLIDVAEGRKTLDDFMAQLSITQMIRLLGGQRNVGVANTYGVGNLPKYDVPEITTADGPAGLRILPKVGVCTTAWPCATMMACTFNTNLAENVGRSAALEIKENNIGIWLAPAANIHRTPMCGRNFEYYSEDPKLAGLIGAAVVKGVQSVNIAATVKHFAFNNKESNRKNSDSRVSERAAREIYLKVFEIIVKESHPWCIMTAYNKVNGIHCSENEELINGILRGEWGFDGLVMTDWWTSGEQYLEIKAGNDLKMANGFPDRVKEAYDKGAITREEIYAAAKNVLNLVLRME